MPRRLSLRLRSWRSPSRPSAAAQDWPQFLGPERNGVYTRSAARRNLAGAGAARRLAQDRSGRDSAARSSSRDASSSFTASANEEVVEALDARTGAAQWRYAYPTTYRDDFGFDEGPRAVPVVADGIVYTFGAEGQLHAVDLAKGKRVWSEDTMQRFGVPKGFFGAAGSPLVEDGRVIANVGGPKAGIVAFDAKTRQGAVDGDRLTGRAIRRRSARRSAAGGSRCS